uniref:Eukaryotic translation initiation factor 2-alpha kinase 2 n=1 Tax=Nothobranchius korthausae TaxID=1143690 RepID=A0A1A8FD92_9TELE
MESVNYVAKLNEHAHKVRVTVNYDEVGSIGPDHIKTFTLRAVVGGKAYAAGDGKNKKEAKQNAAKNALMVLLDEATESTEHLVEASPVAAGQLKTFNCIGWLNEYGQRNHLSIKPEETTSLGPNTATHRCRFVVDGKEYPAASGRTKKEAKEEAAKLVYQEITGSKTLDTRSGDSGTSSLHESEKSVSHISDQIASLSIKNDNISASDTNILELIHGFCQRTRRSCVFKEEKRCGPSHCQIFFFRLVMDNKEYPVGEGKSIKEAKQHAAQLAWLALKEQLGWDSKIVASDEGLHVKGSPPSSLQDAGHAESKCMTPATGGSDVFKDSPKTPNQRVQSPGAKPKIKLAPNFQRLDDRSKEDMVNFEVKEKRDSHRAKTRTTASFSSNNRFKEDYDSIERLGKGSFGHVFKARHKLENKFYAVKVVHYKKETLQEAMALSDLNHCNIVRYHSCWISNVDHQWDSSTESSSASQPSIDSPAEFLYMQMELCAVKTLRVWIDEKNIQNPKKSLRDSKRKEESLIIALQIVSGVEHIHSRMLIHRDLKPANIMFSQNNTVKIGDFGLVTPEIEDDTKNQKERSGYKGTPSYMAPEQRGRVLYDRKVDIFALGLIYFELLWNLPINEKCEIWNDVRSQKLPQQFIFHFNQESQLIKSMLCDKPEGRPEASKIKTDIEDYKTSLEKMKTMQKDSRTV